VQGVRIVPAAVQPDELRYGDDGSDVVVAGVLEVSADEDVADGEGDVAAKSLEWSASSISSSVVGCARPELVKPQRALYGRRGARFRAK
jgi:hypothetical protein